MADARPGQAIVVADGDYTSPIRLEAKGLENNPVLVRAAKPGGARISSPLILSGTGLTVSGFSFSKRGSVAIDGRGIRLSRCTMNNVELGKWVTVSSGSRKVRIDHCLFEHKENNTKMTKSCQLLQITVLNKNEEHHVHHNHFRDVPKGASGNGFETIQLITKDNPFDPPPGKSGTIIENNLFERCNGESEIISIKAHGNQIRGNTFRACAGELTLRHGHGNTVAGNFFFADGQTGSGGVRLQGRDQLVVNNYFFGLHRGVCIMKGTSDALYVQVERANVLFNSFVDCRAALEIGALHSSYPKGEAPLDCRIVGNVFFATDKAGANTRAVRLMPNTELMGWSWADNVANTQTGIPDMPGLSRADPGLRLLETGLAIPTENTPTADLRLRKLPELGIDILGQQRKQKTTIGAITLPVEARSAGPLDKNQVGPHSP